LVCREFLSPGCAPRKKILFSCPETGINLDSYRLRKIQPSEKISAKLQDQDLPWGNM
jgi:hypothetical protein